MKILMLFLFVLPFSSMIIGLSTNNQFYIGVGVAFIFIVFIPLFSYYRWKGKKWEDYLLTKENLQKMRNRESKKE